MRYAVKANKTNGGRKIVKAYCLGENSEMERQLIQEGAIRKHADGHYELFSLEAKEVPSSAIGEIVMDELKDLDEVAYVRFASVYREFKDVNTFMDELKKFLK